MLHLMSVSVFTMMLAACNTDANTLAADAERRLKIETMYQDYRRSFTEISEIEPKRAMALVKTSKVIFIDERKPEEQAVSMLPNAISAETFLNDPSKYDDHTKIVYCTISYRSGLLAQKLKPKGIELVNLRGGILAWAHDGGEVYDANGPTRRIHVYGPKWDLAPADYQAIW